jgi:hypothetical protein
MVNTKNTDVAKVETDLLGFPIAEAAPLIYKGVDESYADTLYVSDPYRVIRNCKPSKSDTLTWTIPGGKALEIPTDGRRIMALKGYVVDIRSGLMLYDGVEKRPICMSSSATKVTKGIKYTNRSTMPLSTFIYTPNKYDEPNTPIDLLTAHEMTGTQEPGIKCADCVREGKNVFTSQGSHTPNFCGGSMQLIMVVSSFGVKVTDMYTDKVSIEWINWRQMTKHKEITVPLYNSPPVINVGISKAAGSRPAAKQSFVGMGDIIPSNAECWKTVQQNLFLDGQIKILDDGGFRSIVTSEVTMYAAVTVENSEDNKQTATPLFTHAPIEANEDSIISSANNLFVSAFVEAGGRMAADGVTPQSGVDLDSLSSGSNSSKELKGADTITVKASSVEEDVSEAFNDAKPVVLESVETEVEVPDDVFG